MTFTRGLFSPFVQVLVVTATPKHWRARREEARGRKRRAERGMAGEEDRVEEARRGTRNGTRSWMERLKMA